MSIVSLTSDLPNDNTYIFSASYNNGDAYKAFSNGTETWESSAFETKTEKYYTYSGVEKTKITNREMVVLPTSYTTATGPPLNLFDQSKLTVDIVGDWIQVQLPFQAYLSEYTILPPDRPTNVVYSFVIVGSNDTKTWYYIDEHVGNITTYNTDLTTTTTTPVSVTPIHKYSHFRFIITQIIDLTDSTKHTVKINKISLRGSKDTLYIPLQTINPSMRRTIPRETTPLLQGFENINLRRSYRNEMIGDTQNIIIGLGNNIQNTGSFYPYNVNKMQTIQPYSLYENYESEMQEQEQQPTEYLQEEEPQEQQIQNIDAVCNELIQDYDKANKCIELLRAGVNNTQELVQLMNQINNKEGYLVNNMEGFVVREGMTQDEMNTKVQDINRIRATLSNNAKYDFAGNLVMGDEYDDYHRWNKSKKPELIDAVIEDTSQMIYYENTSYILGTIMISVLLISILSMSR